MGDMIVDGKFIPKDTEFHANLYAINYDEKIFENPNCFNPDRFLENNGKKLKKFEEFIPFSIGKQ